VKICSSASTIEMQEIIFLCSIIYYIHLLVRTKGRG
jgi:hypothetical protein